MISFSCAFCSNHLIRQFSFISASSLAINYGKKSIIKYHKKLLILWKNSSLFLFWGMLLYHGGLSGECCQVMYQKLLRILEQMNLVFWNLYFIGEDCMKSLKNALSSPPFLVYFLRNNKFKDLSSNNKFSSVLLYLRGSLYCIYSNLHAIISQQKIPGPVREIFLVHEFNST